MDPVEAFELYRFYHAGEDEIFALRGVSLRVRSGELVAVMGPSGSGKSTLLACLAGLDEPDGGHVELMGNRLSRRPEVARARLRARHIGILLQAGNLFDHLTVGENIRLQLQLARRTDNRHLDRVLALLGLYPLLASLPRQLSGGEIARAGLAVALAPNPDVLLADEPTAEVDAQTGARILDLLARRRGEGGGTIVVTHSLAVADGADRILCLRDGRMVDE
ncbi:MAG: putative transport system ATP-binding protein [Rhodospirillaceae bacterium]|jgi:putative ABC transport system ATP-binding protein|nr:putative transport system ATP-binding protein [Rhodospirillaceae bacterium]